MPIASQTPNMAFEPDSPMKPTFAKIDVKPKDSHNVRLLVLDHADWPAFRKELLGLGRDAVSLARRVWDTLKEHT